MSKTIDAMKLALHQMSMENWGWNSVASTNEKRQAYNTLGNAIKQEEAQTVEPVGCLHVTQGIEGGAAYEIFLTNGMFNMTSLGEYPLFTHQAPATETAKPSMGEREALIEDLRALANELSLDYRTETIDAAAAMLAADAQEIKQLKDFYGTAPVESFRIIENLRVELGTLKAQQVVVPQGFQWPKPPSSKGQSPILFDDGYEEGWAKAISTVQAMLAEAPQPPQGEL